MTAIAWIFIVLGVIGLLLGLFQLVMYKFVLSQAKFADALEMAREQGLMPEIFFAMMKYIDLMLIVFFTWTAMHVVASIGLLLRKNWARLLFIGSLTLAVLYQLVSPVWGYYIMTQMPMPADARVARPFESFMLLSMVGSALFSLGLAAALGWIIWKLVSPNIRQEFVPEAAPSQV